MNSTSVEAPSEERAQQGRSLGRLVRRIKYHVGKKRRSLEVPYDEWQGLVGKSINDGDAVDQIARKAGVDWLLHNATGRAIFFEGM